MVMAETLVAAVGNEAGQISQQSISVAEEFLALLRSRGLSNFFINAGTDFAPIVEGYARRGEDAVAAFPRPIISGHENVVMGMAHGAYLMSGSPQAVMFHVNVGTANAICGAMNAARENVPIMICAGRSPVLEGGKLGARNTRVAWGQEMYDQAGIIRESVKWDYELRSPLQVEDVVDRALTLAMSAPRGPVYLTLPREVLAETPSEPSFPAPRVSISTASHPDPEAVAQLADRLVEAEMPVVSSLASGADSRSVSLMARLCDQFAIGYAEEQARYLNLPSNHPLHLGFSLPPILAQADAWLFLESDVPWIREWGQPRADAFIAQAGVDPGYSAYPMRTHRSDLAIKSGAVPLLEALIEAMQKRSARIDGGRCERIARIASDNQAISARAAREPFANTDRITVSALSAMLGKVLPEHSVLFSEYWAEPQMIPRTQPASYFYLPATGGLGWALPAALGAKLEQPHRTMVAAIGDGTYMFSNPTACHHASQKHGLPVLTVIANNSRWGAVDSTAKLVYPDGYMTKVDWMAISDLRPAPAFDQLVAASGGLGITVSDPAELEDALRRGLHAVEHEGRQALVNVICA